LELAHVAGVVFDQDFGAAVERRPHLKAASCLAAERGEAAGHGKARANTQSPSGTGHDLNYLICSSYRNSCRSAAITES
jgi:hypothetical protein